jgi:hypothetical protein
MYLNTVLHDAMMLQCCNNVAALNTYTLYSITSHLTIVLHDIIFIYFLYVAALNILLFFGQIDYIIGLKTPQTSIVQKPDFKVKYISKIFTYIISEI